MSLRSVEVHVFGLQSILLAFVDSIERIDVNGLKGGKEAMFGQTSVVGPCLLLV